MERQASAGQAFRMGNDSLEVRLIENPLAPAGDEQPRVATEIADTRAKLNTLKPTTTLTDRLRRSIMV